MRKTDDSNVIAIAKLSSNVNVPALGHDGLSGQESGAMASKPSNQMKLHSLVGAIKIIRGLERPNEQVTAQMVHVLLAVARQPGITAQELVTETGLSLSSVSRNLLSLGEWHRFGKPGLNLVESVEDPYERRRKISFLTIRGRTTVQHLMEQVSGDPVTFESPTAREYVNGSYRRIRA